MNVSSYNIAKKYKFRTYGHLLVQIIVSYFSFYLYKGIVCNDKCK